ncbi:vestitone reductase-like isoform X2 [Prosopis cineraria]|uniref:vestitone reductase-like isoform X2 n=1 Tax=Prosopis cineraria TaxID=364024 RepID=UPI0024100771|nr:vestitone reductase-like isoform X2 [Prosopis cineraria]
MEESRGRVCVTGGTGFVGSWIIKRLLEDGYSVNTTIRSHPEQKKDVSFLTNLPGASQRLQILNADLSNPDSFKEAIEGCIGVFHVATPIDFEESEPEEVVTKRSIDGALGILKACVTSKSIKRVVYTSSAVTVSYGGKEDEAKDESSWSDVDFLRTLKIYGSSYAISKTLTEKAVLEFGEQNGLDVVTVIPPAVVGPFICSRLPVSITRNHRVTWKSIWCMWMTWQEHICFCLNIPIQKGGIIVLHVWQPLKKCLRFCLLNIQNFKYQP